MSYVKKTNKDKFITGEADFLIVHRSHGMLLLEVKGGENIQYLPEEKMWSRSRFDDGSMNKFKDPFQQAHRNIYNLIDKIKETDIFGYGIKNVPFAFGYGVVFPDSALLGNIFPTHILPEMLIDSNGMSEVSKSIEKMQYYWQDKSVQAKPFSKTGLEELITKVLAPKFKLVRPYSAQLRDEEDILIRLTDTQFKYLNHSLNENKRALIKGYAGTGKTVLAVEKARRLAEKGKKVLFLCYNVQLANVLKNKTAGWSNITVTNFHRFSRKLLVEHGTNLQFPTTDDQSFWDEVVPGELLNVVSNNNIKYDAIIVDEGQDFSPDWWVPIEEMCHSNSRFYIFYDPIQNIYKRNLDFPNIPTVLPLVENCRTTISINDKVQKYGDVNIPDSSFNLDGEKVQFYPYNRRDEQNTIILNIIREIKKDKRLKSRNIVILSPYNFQKSIFYPEGRLNGYQVVEYSDQNPKENEIRYESIFSFKGLDEDVVILCDISNNKICSRNAIYVGTSRAKHLLYIVYSQDWKI